MTIPFVGINRLFIIFCVVVMVFVAVKHGGFIKVITLGRFTGADAPKAKLRRLQLIAGLSVIFTLTSFVIALLLKAFNRLIAG